MATQFGDTLYERTQWMARDDEQTIVDAEGDELVVRPHYLMCQAIGALFSQVEMLTKASEVVDPDTGRTISYEPWTALLDPDRCPEWALKWLGQFAGIIPWPDGISESDARALIKTRPRTKRGTIGAIVAAAQQYLTGSKTVLVQERYGGDPYVLRIRVLDSEVPGGHTNLVVNPSAEVNVTDGGWATLSSTLSRSTTQAKYGTASFQLTSTVTGNISLYAANSRFAVTPGQTYSASAWFKPGTSTRGVRVKLDWYNVLTGGSRIALNDGPTVQEVSGGWVQATHSAVAPAGATYCMPYVEILGVPSTEVHYIDGVMYTPGPDAAKYFDGSFPGAAWDGTANNSTSTATLSSTIRDAILTQKPAGIVLDFASVSNHSYSAADTTYASYSAADAAFASYLAAEQ